MTTVTIKCRVPLADARAAQRALTRQLSPIVAGVTPQFPDIDDEELSSFFVAEVADEATAALAVRKLLAMPQVEAAYVKPPTELPGG